jgi:hypothetical protein
MTVIEDPLKGMEEFENFMEAIEAYRDVVGEGR